jgi:hypothetical protein
MTTTDMTAAETSDTSEGSLVRTQLRPPSFAN